MQAKAPTERDVEALLCGFETTSNRSWPNESVNSTLTSATRGEMLTPNPNECNSTLSSVTSTNFDFKVQIIKG